METHLNNIYRPTQPLHERNVYASPGTPLPSYEWCYHPHHCADTPPSWQLLPGSHCSSTHQSPINIDKNNAVPDSHLDAFVFKHFDDKHAIKYITNTGHSMKCVLVENLVEESGGGLGHDYTILQFHFHWGDTSDTSEGSEHTVDSKRYPMEVVTKIKHLKHFPQTPSLFIFHVKDATEHRFNLTTNKTNWKNSFIYVLFLSSGQKVSIAAGFSLDDLLVGVNRTKYYRYLGSLTTPTCNEAVVWTVFKEPIKVSKDLVGVISFLSSPVSTQSVRASASSTCFSLGLLLLSLALGWIWS
uniref:Alpha-carbonic anhydrase domain-containing protein n=1 Tax=Pundamilia nyererei TaxID=303518 RepID=A0A3B4GY33_9CICH